MRCLRCQHENRPQAKFCEECASPLDGATRTAPSYADLKAEVESLRPALGEALEQQTATAEILRVIASSPADLQPVLDAVVRSAARLCETSDAAIFRDEGASLRLVAHDGVIPPIAPVGSLVPRRRGSVTGRVVLEGRAIHVPDLQAAAGEFPEGSENARRLGWRATLAVPLMRERTVIGTIGVRRTAARPFSDAQIDLLKTFADQAVIAIENVRLFTELQEKNRALTRAHGQVTEALEQQTATSEILAVISRSPTEVEPVFAAVVASAARLCEAHDVAMLLVDGDDLRLAAGVGPLYMSMPSDFRIRITRDSAATRAVVDRATVHIHDFAAEPEDEYPVGRELARRFGHRTMLAVPLLREGVPIGVICAFRLEVRPFPDNQIELLKTFADQAVIAIENVRLFTELQASNRDLTRALDQQTATSDILRAIAHAQTDVQPVFDTIVRSGLRLLGGYSATMMLLRDGECLDLVAYTSTSAEADASLVDAFPLPLRNLPPGARAVHDRRPHAVEDVESAPDVTNVMRETGRARGWHSNLFTPMIREDVALGLISITRRDPGPFAADEIALVQTFADQAVIAIENVRLFTEVQARNRELTESLEQQTATSEVLQVISRSPSNVEPTFEVIAASAARLCEAVEGTVFRFDGAVIHIAAHCGGVPEQTAALRRVFPIPPGRGSVTARAIMTRAVVHVPDLAADPEHEYSALVTEGFHTVLSVPMLRNGDPIGAITVRRQNVRPFSDKQIALLQTFADQAVIAIENVRLFKELEARTGELTQSVEKLTALGEVSQVLSSTLDLDTVLMTIVNRAVHLSGADGGQIFEYDEVAEEFQPRASNEVEEVVAATQHTRLRKGEGAVGRMAVTREAVQIPDIALEGAYESRARGALLRSGRHALLAVPLLSEEHIVGGLVISRNAAGAFAVEIVELLRTFATQSALAIQNARLFNEIENKSRQLESASRHKSEFLANMSHELRTPLNAVIGFSEVLIQRMFGALNDKQDEYLKDIYASGQHLLSLINDILDLSKIEAGRMELVSAPFHLPSALENAVTLVKERAARHGIALHLDVDPRLDQVVGDERKVKQVVLNLLSNAVKFTPEGGRISVKAALRDGAVEIAVTDTGIGIAPEDQAAIFEEFRQVGSDDARKQEGTGLGLTLAKKFVELHGGRIWVESESGRGSTFTFTLPVS